MKRLRPVLLVSFLAILSVGIAPMVSVANAAPAFEPKSSIREGTSANWSGYAAVTSLASPSSNAVTDVKGTWSVPAVSCGATNAYSAVWLGIDGYSDGTVEQTGTEQDCISGHAVYLAWYEIYPKRPVRFSLSIAPGDQITAEVRYIGSSQFRLTLTNSRTRASASTTQRVHALRQSAEWIVEAPSSSGGVLPLANFGRVSISGASTTIKGVTGPISDSSWAYDAITMAASGHPKAIPSALGSGGSSFSVTWEASR